MLDPEFAEADQAATVSSKINKICWFLPKTSPKYG
jgi:hypothetical protein